MSKQVIEFLKELPVDVRQQAIRYYNIDTNKCKFNCVDHPAIALMYAFNWGETKEGFECWRSIWDALAFKESEDEILKRYKMNTKNKCRCGTFLTGDNLICGSCNLSQM